jgi:hypothetical protein
MKTQADRLQSIATQGPMKEQVRLAVRDLEDALVLLKEPHLQTRPSMLRIVELTIQLVAKRLDVVQTALRDNSP